MAVETLEEKYEVGDQPRLRVDNVRGQVVIRAGADGFIEVRADKHLKSGSDKTQVLMSQNEDGEVVVRTHYDNGSLGIFGRGSGPVRVDYTIEVPKTCTVVAKGVSSRLEISGLTGDLHVRSVNGEMELVDQVGPVRLDTVNGDIRAARITGSLAAKSVSADIKVSESTVPEALLESVSGDMVLETEMGEGPYTFNTVSGDARLTFSDQARGSVIAKTLSGAVSTPWGSRKQRGTLTAGTDDCPVIRFKSVSGDLKVSGPEYETAPEKPIFVEDEEVETQETPLSNQEILDKIAAGEWSVEEGISAMTGS